MHFYALHENMYGSAINFYETKRYNSVIYHFWNQYKTIHNLFTTLPQKHPSKYHSNGNILFNFSIKNLETLRKICSMKLFDVYLFMLILIN